LSSYLRDTPLGIDGTLGAQWEISDEPITVGRSGMADVKIDDDGLSRRHFMIMREGADYLIKDLNSRNGTWVHGHRALTAWLHDNDCILAGNTLFRFCEDRAGASTAPKAGSGPHGTRILQAEVAQAE
jgi:pSer/pThr/pTyr-binding forkhead associated (FHA) protein